MRLGICSFASSSSGNCYLVKSENTNILVDAGISGAKIVAGLSTLGLEPQDLDALVITHEHSDHIKGVNIIMKKAGDTQIFASRGTFEAMNSKDAYKLNRCTTVKAGEAFDIGDIKVTPFNISHDAAEPVGYCFEKDGAKISFATDTGCITEEIEGALRGADLMVLEANHEVNILLYGSYPYDLKRRILSNYGHLSNETTGNYICKMLKELCGEKTPAVYLAHLSQQNNTPSQAYLTVRNILEEDNFYIDKDLKLDVFLKDDISGLVEI